MVSPARRWVVLCAAVVAAAVTARLGVWQLDRARQKADLQARITARASQPVLDTADLARSADAGALQHYRVARLQGRWLAQHTVYLDNRQWNGRAGFIVVTPLLLASADAVLVQRGWVPRHFLDRERVPPIETPAGEVQVIGRVAPQPSRQFEVGPTDDRGRIRQNLDPAAFGTEIGVALRPVSLQQLDGADGTSAAPLSTSTAAGAKPAAAASAATLVRQWPAPALDLGKHHGYAFQWFSLSALITGLYVWFQIVRPRRR